MRHTSLIEANAGGTALSGRVGGIRGTALDIDGVASLLAVGDRLTLEGRGGSGILAEIVGFRGRQAQALAFGPLEGIGPGSRARFSISGPPRAAFGRGATIAPTLSWIGRVVDPLGRPLDGKGPLRAGTARPLRDTPPEAVSRGRLGDRIDFGVRALDGFVTCRQGQRLGLFAGSGVGKSTLLAMLAREARCDLVVLALVGERGREVRDFLEDTLGEDGLGRAVVVVATSDAPPLMRRDAALSAMTIAEYFRDQGRSVLLLMDSVTRYCLALREVALAAGELPAMRGYPASVFADLPRLLERAGPGPADGTGSITALFTVLVEGDDMNEPVADAARGILDGHVVLDRRIAESGRYPAVDVLRSLSRTVPGCLSTAEADLALRARSVLALHAEMADMVRLGAYRAGSDPAVDRALRLAPPILDLLRQGRDDGGTVEQVFAALRLLLEAEHEPR